MHAGKPVETRKRDVQKNPHNGKRNTGGGSGNGPSRHGGGLGMPRTGETVGDEARAAPRPVGKKRSTAYDAETTGFEGPVGWGVSAV